MAYGDFKDLTNVHFQHYVHSNTSTAWKVSKYEVFCGPSFPAFGLSAFGLYTERYSVSLRIQSKCWKIRTRKNSVFGHFSHSGHESRGFYGNMEYTNHIRLYFMECISLFTDQKRAHNNKCFSEVYSQHCKTFNLEIFVKLLTGFRC